MTDTSQQSDIKSLIMCPDCQQEMRLLGIEPESPVRDVFTFECAGCGRLEVRGVRVTE